MQVPAGVQALFKDAVITLLERHRRRLPVNISIINDIMRQRDRRFHFKEVEGCNSFRTLCMWFQKQGLVKILVNGSSVMLQ